MKLQTVVHISEVDISLLSGMGRVEYHWKKAFEKKGFEFIHIGPKEVGPCLHKGLFPYKAYNYFKKLNIDPFAIIVHEPASGLFVKMGIPCFIESHGIERKAWEETFFGPKERSIKTRIFFPIWRLYNCDKGLRKSDKLLLINSDDKAYVNLKYGRSDDDIYIFKNGVNVNEDVEFIDENKPFTILFNGSWIERKGIKVLISAAELLFGKGIIDIEYLLIGVGKSEDEVLSDWPEFLKKSVTVVSRFESKDEIALLNKATVFVLPSFSEGQPLSLLQAMAVGKCCITTNCCGQKDIVINNSSGFFFPVGDSSCLSDVLLKCYEDKELVKRIGNMAKVSMVGRSWEAVSEEVVDYIIDNS